MVKKLTGKLSKITDLSEDVRDFEIDLPENLEFKAGQFVNISFKEGEKLYRRPLSIASTSKIQNQIHLCVKLVPEGHLTPKLWEKSEGDEIEVMGPLGLFTLDKSRKDKIAFIATGTGIGPLKSMILELIANNSEKQITLIFGVRHEGTHHYDDQFEELQKSHPNFKYVKIVSRPSDDWEGRTGHVQDNLDCIDPLNSEVYICGLPIMVTAVEEKLQSLGMDKEDIHDEKY